jgi:hypothetical protein
MMKIAAQRWPRSLMRVAGPQKMQTAELNEARFFTELLRRAELDSISEILVRLRADEDGFKPVA